MHVTIPHPNEVIEQLPCSLEEHVHHLVKCIQLDLDCVAICRTASEMMSLGSEYANKLCELCADICNAGAEE